MPSKKSDRNKTKEYAKYYGMAFEIFGFLFFGALIGRALDNYFDTDYIVAITLLLALVAYFYKLMITLGGGKK